MSLTTTDSLNGRKHKAPQCDQCRRRVSRLIANEMGQKLCDECAPKKLVIGYTVTE